MVAFVIAGNTVKKWILEEYEKKRLEVKAKLVTARSRIHVSFDGWSSPNGLAVVGVVVHYLDKDLVNRSYLIGMRRIRGAHTGENIAEAVMPVLLEMGILSKLGYFIADNDGRNDTCIRAILRKHRPDIKDPDSRRVRCLGHIFCSAKTQTPLRTRTAILKLYERNGGNKDLWESSTTQSSSLDVQHRGARPLKV